MLLEIILIMGLNAESEQALENLRKASEELFREMRVKLLIVPLNTWQDPFNSYLRSYPTIIINGVKAFSGYAPSVDEIKKFVVNYIKKNSGGKSRELMVPAGFIYEDHVYATASIS